MSDKKLSIWRPKVIIGAAVTMLAALPPLLILALFADMIAKSSGSAFDPAHPPPDMAGLELLPIVCVVFLLCSAVAITAGFLTFMGASPAREQGGRMEAEDGEQ